MSELTIAAYGQVGASYQTAVDVSKFTFTAFSAWNIALLGAAGYLLHEKPATENSVVAHLPLLLAAVLLGFGAVIAVVPVRMQMDENQRVIRRVLAAGILLEYAHPELGTLYQHAINEQDRKDFVKVYKPELNSDGKKVAPACKNLMDEADIAKLGRSPQGELIARVYGTGYVVLAAVALCAFFLA